MGTVKQILISSIGAGNPHQNPVICSFTYEKESYSVENLQRNSLTWPESQKRNSHDMVTLRSKSGSICERQGKRVSGLSLNWHRGAKSLIIYIPCPVIELSLLCIFCLPWS